MKTIHAGILLLVAILPSTASAQLKRLVHTTGTVSEWTPSKERNGNLIKFSQTTKKLGLTLRSSGLTWSDLSARGFKHVGNGINVPWEHNVCIPGTHESGPHATQLGKPASQWTQAECYNFGRNVIPVFGMTADQLGEGYSAEELSGYVATESNTYRWICEGMRDKAATMNPPAILLGTYATKINGFLTFRPGGGNWAPNSAANRNALASGANARAGLNWFDLDVSHYIMPLYQFYPWDQSLEQHYMQAYCIQRLQKACEGWASPGATLSAYLFAWPLLEGGGIANANYAYEHPMSNGRLYQHAHSAFSFNSFLSLCLNTFVLTGSKGGIYIWEDTFTFSETNPDKVAVDYTNAYRPSDIWKTTTGAARPNSSPAPTMPPRPLGQFNAPIVAAEYYGEMVAAGGENFQFTRFKIGAGAWIEPGADSTSILEAAAQYRGWCVSAQNGTGYAVYYTNPYASIAGETITVDLGGGKTVTFDCFQDEPVVIAGTHPGGTVVLPRREAFR